MRIGKQLITGFIAVSLLGAGMGGLGVYNMHLLAESGEYMYERMVVPLEDMAIMMSSVNRQRSYALQAILSPEAAFLRELEVKLREREEEMKRRSGATRPAPCSPGFGRRKRPSTRTSTASWRS